jgi:hypothetical protein
MLRRIVVRQRQVIQVFQLENRGRIPVSAAPRVRMPLAGGSFEGAALHGKVLHQASVRPSVDHGVNMGKSRSA